MEECRINQQEVGLAPRHRVIEKKYLHGSMEMPFFAACPWPRPGMQGPSSMDHISALLPFPYNIPAMSGQGRPVTEILANGSRSLTIR